MHDKFFRGLAVFFIVGFYLAVAYQCFTRNDIQSVEAALMPSVTQPSTEKTVDYGTLRAKIALEEYKKGVKEAQSGCNCGEDVDKYTEGNRQQWCAMFSSWVYKQAGTPFTGEESPENWRINQARQIGKWLEKNGTWFDKEEVIAQNITPQVGDVMIFWRGNFEGNLGHADIVVGVDPSSKGYASLVGGNLNDQVTFRKSYFFKDHYGFLGFGRLEKPVKKELKIKGQHTIKKTTLPRALSPLSPDGVLNQKLSTSTNKLLNN